ncbi:hypothetical protein BG74_00695 [Sodalis-like endosymbiont of Proechinophthirus fluctus]|nr:hypothetical protein BG74_00695 [Sodalis-like endosymbiont of Proechinophthirus fluctus]
MVELEENFSISMAYVNNSGDHNRMVFALKLFNSIQFNLFDFRESHEGGNEGMGMGVGARVSN